MFLDAYKSGVSICLILIVNKTIFAINCGGDHAILVSDPLKSPAKVQQVITHRSSNQGQMKEISLFGAVTKMSEFSTPRGSAQGPAQGPVMGNLMGNLMDGLNTMVYQERFKFTDLIPKHDVKNIAEIDRIASCGAVLEMERDQFGDPIGSMKIFNPADNSETFAYTRCVGDFAAIEIGVNATPEVEIHSITEDYRFVIISTNYIWDNISRIIFKKIVKRPMDRHDLKGINRAIFERFDRDQKLLNKKRNEKKGPEDVESQFNEPPDFLCITIKL
jgi:hypothetical protein